MHIKRGRFWLSSIISAALLFSIFTSLPSAQAAGVLPDWAKSATIYEVNMRQYTKAGTFNAFSASLPRLKTLGVKILWLMPVQPISKLNRKGTLGSPYSIADYKGINPEYGSDADLIVLSLTTLQKDDILILREAQDSPIEVEKYGQIGYLYLSPSLF